MLLRSSLVPGPQVSRADVLCPLWTGTLVLAPTASHAAQCAQSSLHPWPALSAGSLLLVGAGGTEGQAGSCSRVGALCPHHAHVASCSPQLTSRPGGSVPMQTLICPLVSPSWLT